MSTLKELKSIPNKPKYTTFGYIHEMEKQLALSNVPAMINYLCLGYYFHGEFFEKAGDDLQICNDKMSIERITPAIFGDEWMNTGYGKLKVSADSKYVITWKFVIESFGDGGQDVFIGIVSKDNRLNEDFASYGDDPYTYFQIHFNDLHDQYIEEEHDKDNAHIWLRPMQIYRLVFDTLKWKVSVKKDAYIIGLRNIAHFPKDDTKYKFAISMVSKYAKITICDFEIK